VFIVMKFLAAANLDDGVAGMTGIPLYPPCIYDMYGVRPVDIVRLFDDDKVRKDLNDLIHCRKASLKNGQWPINGELIQLVMCLICTIIVSKTSCPLRRKTVSHSLTRLEFDHIWVRAPYI
jgi:hypothetical protein